MAQARVLFQGVNSTGQKGLWVTDGTTLGTSELTPINNAYPGGVTPSGGLTPSNMAVFNGDVLFGGRNTSGASGLWITDGTAVNTSELTPIARANTSTSGGLSPFDLTVFNGEVLFGGEDTDSNDGLWVTNGTAGGTHELTGISGANTNGGILGTFTVGLTPLNPYMTLLNNEVLFAGFDNTHGNAGLWESNGTVAGTFELTGINGANTNGLAPNSLVAFNGEVLFAGSDTTTAHGGLWVTDGTVLGTKELTNISGANTNGLEPFDLTVFNNEVLFSGNNTGGLFTLFLTDGTALGTHEVTGITGAYVGGVTHVFDPQFTILNGEALFEGEDTAGNFGLWVSNGTGTGTFELTGINGANTNGIFAGINVPFFTLRNGEVLFEGSNTNGQDGLWVTDGTVGGTHEVTGISGAFTGTTPPGLSPQFLTLMQTGPALTNVAPSASFTEEGGAVTLSNAVSVTDSSSANLAGATVQITGGAFAGDVLSATGNGTISASYNAGTETLTLTGADTLAHYQAVLDTLSFNAGENPTNFGANPTRTVTWTLNDGSASSAPVTSTINVTNVNDPPSLSNVVASAVVTFPGQIITLSPGASVSDRDNQNLAGATVQITGGAFAGDVLSATGNGTILANYNAGTETLTLTGPDTLAHYAQVLDSVTFNSTSGNPTNFGANPTRTVTWTLNDGSGSNNLSTPATTTITFRGSIPFDLNDDTISDLAFQNNGQPGIWLWNGTAPTAEVGLTNPGASWHVVTSRDVNGDHNADLIWQNSDGTPGIWLMNGTTPTAEVGLTNPGATWHLVAAGDVNGDGDADLIWQDNSGTLGVWEMNGTTPIAEADIGSPGANWKVVGTADFNGDSHDDILLQNTVTGNLMVDLMNGTSVASSVAITVGDPSWHAVSTGEFNGQAAIAWQQNGGTAGLWLMNGTTPAAEMGFSNPGPGWQLISVDHFTPNGQPDLLFQNTNGALQLWEINGTSVAATLNLPSAGGWQSVNGHPFASG